MVSKKTILCIFFFCSALSLFSQTEWVGDFQLNGTVLVGYRGMAANVIIPENLGITEISRRAFSISNSRNITSLTIPASVTSIGDRTPFDYCNNLMQINVDERNIFFRSIDGILFNKDLTRIIRYPPAKQGQTYVIPNSVRTIGYGAFSNCINLTNITIPTSVTSIDYEAFYGCRSLINIIIPNGVTSIGYYTFGGCYSLTNIIIPDSVTYIGMNAFAYCRNLTNIIIPASVNEISGGAFGDCDALLPSVRQEIEKRFGNVFTPEGG
ncbi:MAG: leucine-rich repeat domain-containing protein [Treponema sp.]|nr:leucine-rich repeat domain-containing protein [Treponema sp.]